MTGNSVCVDTVCPAVNCPKPVRIGCCDDCLQCDVNGTVYLDGETIAFGDPCISGRCVFGQYPALLSETRCRLTYLGFSLCFTGQVISSEQTCPDTSSSCAEVVRNEGECCPVCRGCRIGSEINALSNFADSRQLRGQPISIDQPSRKLQGNVS